MALFDPSPKSDPCSLYGREKELNDLVNHLKGKRWVILLGPRRIGKTSLARCALSMLALKNVEVDARNNNDLAQALALALAPRGRSFQVHGGISIPLTPLSLGMGYTRSSVKEGLDRLLEGHDRLLILVDEAQWLRNPRGVSLLLAHIYDYHYDRITFIITGSAVGVMKSILEPRARSPLYGRAIEKMDVNRWGPSTSLSFLKEGCREKKVRYDEDALAKVVDALDGIPGWLTLFGHRYSLHPERGSDVLRETVDEALKIVSEELERAGSLALGWPRQTEILRALASGTSRFTELAEATGLDNVGLSRHLEMLRRLNYVERDPEGRYRIVDPVVVEFLRKRNK
jgi:AAA+ ATPase superfamily predicted ATPase